MFRVPPHPSSGVPKNVPAACDTGRNIGTATYLQRVSAYASVKGFLVTDIRIHTVKSLANIHEERNNDK
jgi:hypothetical protein